MNGVRQELDSSRHGERSHTGTGGGDQASRGVSCRVPGVDALLEAPIEHGKGAIPESSRTLSVEAADRWDGMTGTGDQTLRVQLSASRRAAVQGTGDEPPNLRLMALRRGSAAGGGINEAKIPPGHQV